MKSAALLPPGSPRWNRAAWERRTRHISFNALLLSSRGQSPDPPASASEQLHCVLRVEAAPPCFFGPDSISLPVAGTAVAEAEDSGYTALGHCCQSCSSLAQLPLSMKRNSRKTSSQGFF
ncbi:hypothetical protein QQF64_032865 [Cirrhinus molitorella]|uniref:Uncharacterized protein n=1 Tax=Cirrhinus molitorella TaxID=172907 RepID=A0ABR3MSE4_9TELE